MCASRNASPNHSLSFIQFHFFSNPILIYMFIFVPLFIFIVVAGKKGKMMERRILKDFQIGIVESIVNEAVKNSSESGDVFSTIAKALNKRSQTKPYVFDPMIRYDFMLLKYVCFLSFFYFNSKTQDWNELVRKNTLVKDPIGSTRNSLTRRDRRSLRRRILEEVDHGLKMDTDRIVGVYGTIVRIKFRIVCFLNSVFHLLSWLLEFNPKLSEATKTTRIAYVKFMAPTIRRESLADGEKGANNPTEADTTKIRKSILRAASKSSTVCHIKCHTSVLAKLTSS